MADDRDDDRPLFEGRSPADEADEELPRRRRPELDDDYDRPRARRYDDEDRPRRRRHREEGDATGGLIPYKNGKALAAYYTGVFGLIPCVGGILGTIAVVLGFMGLRYAREHPEARGQAHAIVGIVLGVIEILLYLVAPAVFFVIAALSK